MKAFTPALFMPSATLLIDDDKYFIETIANLLPAYTYPKVVEQQEIYNLNDKQLVLSSGKLVSYAATNSIESLSKLFNDNSAPPISTIVIDQYMSPKTGIEICSKIKNPFIQKILISNILTNNEAIEAINNGVINLYLCKMKSNFIEELNKAICESQNRYFHNISLALNGFLSDDNPLLEKEIFALFKRLKNNFNTPYYFADSNFKKFLFFNPELKNKKILQFFSEGELHAFLNSHHAETATQETLNLIENGKMLPCFEETFIPDGKNWGEYLQPAQIFQGKQKYFYSTY